MLACLQINIIKKFIFDFIKLMDEIRKEKRRREMEDSDEDDDDPFHNKSTFSPAKRIGAGTPTSAKAGSVAGRSVASAAKSAGGGTVNIQAGVGGRGGQAQGAPGAANEFTEFVGENCPEYHAKLKELWNRRTDFMKVRKPGRRKGKGKKRGGMRKAAGGTSEAGDTATVYQDD